MHDAQPQSHKPHFVALDSMRGISACIVVLLHVFGDGIITGSTFISRGYVFVDFFFVLSGFVIAASYGARLAEGFPPRNFALLRLGRLYPLHLAMLLAFVVLIGLRDTDVLPSDAKLWSLASFNWDQLLRSLLMVENFVPGVSGWNGPSWSIEVEFWTYMVAALAFTVLKARAWLFFAATVIGGGGWMVLYYLGLRFQPLGLEPANLVRCLYAFALGVLAWELYRRLQQWRAQRKRAMSPRALSLLEIGLVIGTFALVSLVPLLVLRPLIPLYFTFFLLVLSHEQGVISRLLKRPFPALLGQLSYSIYMTHAAVMMTIALVAARLGVFDSSAALVPGSVGSVPSGIASDLFAFAMLSVVVGVSWCTYRWVEKPARDWSRKVATTPSYPD